MDEAELHLTRLKKRVGMVKIGYALLLRDGRSALKRLYEISGLPIFVDLKLHDIPRTVAQAATVITSASDHIRFLTVHLSDGESIVHAARDAVRPGVGILGVTMLTSLPGEAAGEGATERVVALARIAKQAGCEGVVCSGYEAQAVKQAVGQDFLVVVPGIRPSWAEITNDDQRRAMTPGEAIAQGADYLVIGRPIFTSQDPAGAADRVVQEVDEALRRRGPIPIKPV